jgi:hypothetical protein
MVHGPTNSNALKDLKMNGLLASERRCSAAAVALASEIPLRNVHMQMPNLMLNIDQALRDWRSGTLGAS